MRAITKPLFGALPALVAALLFVGANTAHAEVRITEVSAWGSGNAPYATDWFELTNTGTSLVNIAGWQMDDSSNGTAKVALAGITSIAAGESVIFTENPASASFFSTWFGAAGKPGLQIGTYSGSGVGLSTSGDAVNIFDASGVLQANVTFATSDSSSPYQTFDNAVGLNNTAISQLSVTGTNGAFVAFGDASEIGSPGSIAAVPEAGSLAMLLSGLGLIGFISRKRLS